MNEADIRVRTADWEREKAALREIRCRVFIEEQHVPRDLEWDGRDENAIHVLACNPLGETVGTGRLLPTGQIGRMAVLPGWRGRGIGGAILQRLVKLAESEGMTRLFLHAQVSALPFYLRHGFVPTGDTFTEAGILHRNMEYVKDE